MAKRPGANKENYEETQSIFLALARLEFATHGYAGASTNRIVEQSGMARGSLYYHFKDKADLFRTIFRKLTTESNAEIARHTSKVEDPWEALLRGADLFFEHSLDPTFRRIVLIEALVAIPYLERISITGENYARTIMTMLEKARDRSYIHPDTNMRHLCLMIYGVLAEYARSLEYESNPETAKHALLNTFGWMLDRLKEEPVK